MSWLTDARDQARGPAKAMSDLHPEIQERVHVLSVLQQDVPLPAGYSYLDAIGHFESAVWVRKATSVWATNISALPVGVVRAVAGQGAEPLPNHLVSRVLTRVNERLSSADLWQQWAVDMALGGEEFWELIRSKGGELLEVWPRQPHTVSLIPDQAKLRYFGVAGYKIDDRQGPAYTLPPGECVHYKFFNPRHPWRGIGPIGAVRMAIVIDLLAQAWSRLFFASSARPDYALITPQGLTSTEREEVEKKLVVKFGGVVNAHKPIVLEEGITDIKPLTYPPKDMEWVEQRSLAREEQGAIFGVPDEIMGWGRDTYENFDTAERVLWTLTLVPLTRLRDTTLTESLQRSGDLAPDETIATDLSGVGALREKEMEAWNRAREQLDRGALTINDWRRGKGLAPYPWGERWWAPLGLAPVAGRPPAGGESAASPNAKHLLSERQRRLPPGPTPRQLAPGALATQKTVFAFGSEAHADYWETKDARLNRQRREMEDGLSDEFERQQREVVKRVRARMRTLEVGGAVVQAYRLNGESGEVLGPIAKLGAADVFDAEEEAKRFRQEFEPVIADALEAAGRDALLEVVPGGAFDVERPSVQRAMQGLLRAFAEKVNDTTYDELSVLFEQAAADGVGLSEIVNRLDSYFESRRDAASLERIARTTMTGASGIGDLEAWQQSEVVESKEWVAALDDRTRDDHREAHGQVVALNDDFEVGGESLAHPGDPSASPEQIVNCRCVQVAVLREAQAERSRASAGAPIVVTPVIHVHLPQPAQLQPVVVTPGAPALGGGEALIPPVGRAADAPLTRALGAGGAVAQIQEQILQAMDAEAERAAAQAREEMVTGEFGRMADRLRDQVEGALVTMSAYLEGMADRMQTRQQEQGGDMDERIGALAQRLGRLDTGLAQVSAGQEILAARPVAPPVAEVDPETLEAVARLVAQQTAEASVIVSQEVLERDELGRMLVVQQLLADGRALVYRIERDDQGHITLLKHRRDKES